MVWATFAMCVVAAAANIWCLAQNIRRYRRLKKVVRRLREFSTRTPSHRFVCQSYDLSGTFAQETTHAHQQGLEMELRAIVASGRWARVQDRTTGDVWRP